MCVLKSEAQNEGQDRPNRKVKTKTGKCGKHPCLAIAFLISLELWQRVTTCSQVFGDSPGSSGRSTLQNVRAKIRLRLPHVEAKGKRDLLICRYLLRALAMCMSQPTDLTHLSCTRVLPHHDMHFFLCCAPFLGLSSQKCTSHAGKEIGLWPGSLSFNYREGSPSTNLFHVVP